MTKNELVSFLERGRKIEEAIQLYAKHIKNTLYLSGFKKELHNDVKKVLDTLSQDNDERKVFMKQLIDKVKQGDQDVY